MDTMGDRIRLLRIEKNLSQEELALKVGYNTRAAISKIEKNERDLRPNKLKAIADALETTPLYLMGMEDEKKAEQEYMNSMAEKFAQLNTENQKTIETMINALLLQQFSEGGDK